MIELALLVLVVDLVATVGIVRSRRRAVRARARARYPFAGHARYRLDRVEAW